jgi:RHS repeat-associated protein
LYDVRERVSRIDEAFGTAAQRSTTFLYDSESELLSTTTGVAATGAHTMTTSFGYDLYEDRTSMIEGYGGNPNRTTTWAYDLALNVTSVTDPLGHITSTSYDALNRPIQIDEAATTSAQRSTTMVYDAVGNLLSETTGIASTNPNVVTTSFLYDKLDRATQVIEAYGITGLQRTTTTVYDKESDVLQTIDALGRITSMSYDALNRVTQVDQAYGTTVQHSSTMIYDATDNLLSQTIGIATTNPQVLTTSFGYDHLNRETQVIDAFGVSGLQRTSTVVYDAVDNVVNTIDGLGQKTTFVYDALNRQVQTIDARGGITTVSYDAADNPLAVTDSVNNITTFQYDLLSRVTQRTDPLNHSSTYAYDLVDNLTSVTDRDGRIRILGYDALNRLTTEYWRTGGPTPSANFTFSYDAQDNMLTAQNNNGNYTMAYDALGRQTSVQEPFSLILTATYDAVDNRTKLQDNFGGVTTSVYDALDRLTSRQFTGQAPARIDLTYTAQDEINTVTRYSDVGGSTKVGSSTYVYDALGEITNLQHRDSSGNLLANYTYTYDLGSRLTAETLNGNTKSYSYDLTNQLTNDSSVTYTYDLNGNRTMTGYQTGPGNQLTNDGTWTYTYDAEGNLSQKSRATGETWSFSYDVWNHMVGAKDVSGTGTTLTLATYVYDAFGNRLESDVWTSSSGSTATTRFGYDGRSAWADLNSSNQLQTRRLYLDGVDQVFARISSGGTVAWYLPDRLGSIRDITNDTSGAVIDHLDYDGFGNATETQPANGDRYKWTGSEFDTETGLYHFGWRFYDPKIGRWTSTDPIEFAGGDDNLYRYVGNAATASTDPTGLDFWKPWTWFYGPATVLGELIGRDRMLDEKHQKAMDDMADRHSRIEQRVPREGSNLGQSAMQVLPPGTAAGIRQGLGDCENLAKLGVTWAASGGMFVSGGNRFVFNAGRWKNVKTGRFATTEEAAAANEAMKAVGKVPTGIKAAFKGPPVVETLTEDIYVYRYWGGVAKETGSWFSTTQYECGQAARRAMALPRANSGLRVTQFKIPKGTTIIRGEAASMAGKKEFWPGATGGAPQIYLPDPRKAIKVD